MYEIFAGFFSYILHGIMAHFQCTRLVAFVGEVKIVELSSCAGILEQYMGARLHRRAESIPGVLYCLKIPSLISEHAIG
jgi:hypothetical protein